MKPVFSAYIYEALFYAVQDYPINYIVHYVILKTKGEKVNYKNYLTADDVANELSISKACAYKIIRKLNDELREKGFLTVCGRVNTKYFGERVYDFDRRQAGVDKL